MRIRRHNGNFQFEEDPFAVKDGSISEIYHEELLLMKFFQTKPNVKNMNFNYYDLYYTLDKNRDDIQTVNEEYEINENDYFCFEDFITPNHYIGRKIDDSILR